MNRKKFQRRTLRAAIITAKYITRLDAQFGARVNLEWNTVKGQARALRFRTLMIQCGATLPPMEVTE